MKYTPLFDLAARDSKSSSEYSGAYSENPLILPSKVWRNVVINFDHLKHATQRAYPRVSCFGAAVLYDKKGRIVARGGLQDINEKSVGLEIQTVDLVMNDVLYLTLPEFSEFVLDHVKVILRRIQVRGRYLKIGLEFVDVTSVFESKLGKLLAEKRRQAGSFTETESF